MKGSGGKIIFSNGIRFIEVNLKYFSENILENYFILYGANGVSNGGGGWLHAKLAIG